MKNDEILIGRWRVRLFRMHDERAEHAHHFLHRHMRVVKVRSRLMQRKFVNKTSAGLNRILADSRSSVHLMRNFKSMPVHRRRFGQMIIDNNPHAVSLRDLDGRPWRAAVVAPDVNRFVRSDLLFYRLGNEMKDLNSVVNIEAQILEIRRFDRNQS